MSRGFHAWRLLGLVLCVAAVACRRPPPEPDVAARIEATPVHYAEFERYLERSVGGSEGELRSDVLSALFDQFLDERLLLRLAHDQGLARESSDPRRATDALLGSDAASRPSEGEVAAYYATHRKDFVRPERVRLHQLLTENKTKAEAARRQIAGGADFDQVARRLAPAAEASSYRAELSRTDLPPQLADVIFALKPGEVSKVIPESYGFHVFLVESILPAELAPLPEVEEEIQSRLRQNRADSLMAALVKQVRARYNVKVYERNLAFRYGGYYSDAHHEKGGR
jgi:parvulin-like peptidyl-prolyl isomerase